MVYKQCDRWLQHIGFYPFMKNIIQLMQMIMYIFTEYF